MNCFYVYSMIIFVLFKNENTFSNANSQGGGNGGDGVTIRFLIFGDWGVQVPAEGFGTYWNIMVAKTMSTFVYTYPVNQVIALGNNFYPNGVESIYDSLWTQYFSNVYSYDTIKVKWQAVFGNIDYGSDGSDGTTPKQGNVVAQALFETDERWLAMHCTYLTYTVPETYVTIDVIYIDTPLIGTSIFL